MPNDDMNISAAIYSSVSRIFLGGELNGGVCYSSRHSSGEQFSSAMDNVVKYASFSVSYRIFVFQYLWHLAWHCLKFSSNKTVFASSQELWCYPILLRAKPVPVSSAKSSCTLATVLYLAPRTHVWALWQQCQSQALFMNTLHQEH